MILWLITLALLLGILYFWYSRRNLYRLAAKIPVVEGTQPIIGVGHKVIGDNESIMSSLQQFSYSSMRNDGIVVMWLAHILYFIVVDPVDMEYILKTCLEKDDLHRFMRKLLGYGGAFAPVSIWRRRRKVMVTVFSPRIVDNFVPVFAKQSQILVTKLTGNTDGAKVDMWPFLSTYTMDSVCGNTKEERRNKKENASITGGDHEYDFTLYRNTTFLDLLIKLSGNENGFTNVELREETLTLTIAGTDTSAIAMAYTIKLLAKYPEVQQKVYQELYYVFGDSARPLLKEDLLKLKYMERVIKESLRLFPPVPFIIRKVIEDTRLPSGRVLPAGSGIVCSIWGIHRDPKYWGSKAEEFDPDRFLPERFNLKHACSFMPFSAGPRNCLGYQYALMSIKTALSTILREHKIVEDRENGPVPKIRVKLDIMMKAVDGYEVALEKREKVPAP